MICPSDPIVTAAESSVTRKTAREPTVEHSDVRLCVNYSITQRSSTQLTRCSFACSRLLLSSRTKTDHQSGHALRNSKENLVTFLVAREASFAEHRGKSKPRSDAMRSRCSDCGKGPSRISFGNYEYEKSSLLYFQPRLCSELYVKFSRTRHYPLHSLQLFSYFLRILKLRTTDDLAMHTFESMPLTLYQLLVSKTNHSKLFALYPSKSVPRGMCIRLSRRSSNPLRLKLHRRKRTVLVLRAP